MDLVTSLDGKKSTCEADCDGQWPSIKAKLEYIEEGDKFIEFKLIHEGKAILDGTYPGI